MFAWKYRFVTEFFHATSVFTNIYTFLKVRRPSLVFRSRYQIDNRRIIQFGCKLFSNKIERHHRGSLCTTDLECMYRYPVKVIKTHRFRYHKSRRNEATRKTIFRQYAFLVDEKQSSHLRVWSSVLWSCGKFHFKRKIKQPAKTWPNSISSFVIPPRIIFLRNAFCNFVTRSFRALVERVIADRFSRIPAKFITPISNANENNKNMYRLWTCIHIYIYIHAHTHIYIYIYI